MIADYIKQTICVSSSPIGTQGESAVAHYVYSQRMDGRYRLFKDSNYFGLNRVYDDLFDIASKCRAENWDGQGASPVTPESLYLACRFLYALPLGTALPSVGVEPDGEMTLEWYHSPRRTLSISFGKNYELSYSALFGASKAYGSEPFFGEIPKNIMEFIARVVSQQ